MINFDVRKRRNHYVWKDYLKAWSSDEKLYCLINNKIIFEKSSRVAVEKDFYAFEYLLEEDLKIVMSFIEQSGAHLRETHESTLSQYLLAQRALSFFQPRASGNALASELIDAFKSNYFEEWHARVEVGAAKYIADLREGDTDFLANKDSCIDFSIYIATQYFRTKRIKESARSALARVFVADFVDRAWLLISQLSINNVAWGIWDKIKRNGVKLIKNNTEVNFITSDQPVINVLADPEDLKNPPLRAVMYYPVSPRVAILIGEENGESLVDEILDCIECVNCLNDKVFENSLLWGFSCNKKDLLRYVHQAIE